MRRYRRASIAVTLLVVGAAPVYARTDMSIVSCRAFLGSGQANMAAIIMWLRGYHAGKRGVIDIIDQPPRGLTAAGWATIARSTRARA
jgi:hypothetical protein